jgi:large repetitive protein
VGTVVTINGSNLAGVSAVSFGGTPASVITPVNATSVKATVPAGAQTGVVQVTNAAGTGGALTFKVTPKLTLLSPTSGIRGSSVEITGTTFTGASAVKFGAVAATTFSVDTDSKITVTVPSTATTGNVTVTTPAGTSNGLAYTVVLPPTTSSFSPTSGPTGATVTINGANLTGVTDVTFNGLASPKLTPVSATQLKAVVPNGATTGKIGLTGPGGTTLSASNFTVTFSITGFTPSSGDWGTTVTITGVGFSKVTGPLKFGDVTAGGSIDSDTQITTTVPDGAVTAPIVLSNGTSSVTSAEEFIVITPPLSVRSRSPDAAPPDVTVPSVASRATYRSPATVGSGSRMATAA